MRLFLAIPLPASLQDELHAATRALREAAPDVRWTPAAKLHITVRFFGEQPESFVPRAVEALAPAARHTPALDLGLKGLGAFPTWTRARVVWAGVGYDPRLELLHHDLEVACISLGLDVEGRPFRPHVTLARLQPSGGEVARAIRLAARGLRVRATFPCTHVHLMQSLVDPSGHRYETLATIPLGSPR
ncbi:MAG: RNA 2',3'-cyclic phosphodiesterase [Gemmatimonadetes bacterium]|nr:RNA 2',3'-cyclic phosphodiesterase [Gemmatimonadota bacterium]